MKCLALLPALLFGAAVASAQDHRLVELSYQNPGLEVDLGVGLWAWPLPMDYDGDGDLDLLVACPDKPSNGVYFFENPSQDPKERFPVFKPGVRVGKAGHNYQVSHVDGKPRILKPGYECVWNEKSQRFDFDKPKKIYPRGNVHTPGRKIRGNMWRYVDYDGDGDQDLVMGVGDWSDYVWDQAYDRQGRWRNGPLHGYVYLAINEGHDDDPNYASAQKVKAGGAPIDVYGWPCPNFGDFDGDGDLDLICGEFLDGFTWFENQGSREEPVYAAGRRLLGEDEQAIRLDLQMITPSAIDWDQDGDLDLVVGDEDGRVALVEHLGKAKRGMPVFAEPVYFQQEADTLKFGALATPFAYDWDADGDEDLLCGNTAGYIGFFENLGAENGRIYFIKHDDCLRYTGDQIVARSPQTSEPRFAGLVQEGFIYEKAPFPECHASSLCETPRGLVATWFGGTKERNPDVGIWVSYHDGSRWTSPREVANGIQHDGHRHPCWNPVLFQPPGHAPTLLFFKVGPNAREWWGEVMVSYDFGRSFRDRRRLPEGIDGPVRCKPLLLDDGTLLCPSSTEHDDDWRFHFEVLSDLERPELGTSWSRFEPETQPWQVIQPTLMTQEDGTLRALMRSKHERIAQSVSKDGGKTWSELELTNLPNNNSGIESLTLSDGRHLLLYNHATGQPGRAGGWGRRNVLNLAVSEDGQTWKRVATIEKQDSGEFSYPAMIQTSDGLVHMTYTWKRERVKHVVVDPEKLVPGEILSVEDL